MNAKEILEKLQMYGKQEQWEEMDKLILSACNLPEIIAWSLEKGIFDTDRNIRDLAVSILEKSSYPLSDEDKDKLHKLLKNDTNIYVQYRSAFTLFNRGEKTKDVLDKMELAKKDADVSEIAKGYVG